MSPAGSSYTKNMLGACCYTSAMETRATYCEACGRALIRCMAFEECGGLIGDDGQCAVCVAPDLLLSAGALLSAKAGGAVALPVEISNRSAIARPLFVTGLWTREDKGAWQPETLGWERLNQDEQRPVMLRASRFDRAGLHTVEVMIAVASRWRWREERFAFSGAITLDIEDDAERPGPVVNIGGQSAGHGNTVYISGQSPNEPRQARLSKALPIGLSRAEKEERRLGLRGTEGVSSVPRGTPLSWRGFPVKETPFNGPILTRDGLLAAGRARVGDGANDVRLLAETAQGRVDEALSACLSRRHFEFFIQCDRLMLRVTGSGGVKLNGQTIRRDQIAALKDGDVIAPLIDAPGALSLRVSVTTEHGQASAVFIDRVPPSQRQDAADA